MADEYKVVVSFYSLAEGQIGRPVDRKPSVTRFDSVIDALMDLHNAILDNRGYRIGEGQRMVIEMPDGRQLSFNDVYTDTFHEWPIRTEQGYLYPCLLETDRKKARRMGWRQKENANE